MRWTHLLSAGWCGVMGAASPLLAQIPDKPGPPPEGGSVLTYVIMLALVGVVCMGALKSSKRGHQD